MRNVNILNILSLLLAMGLNAETIVVDLAGGGDYTNMHDAVEAAADGDTILVLSGTFINSAEDGIISVDKELHLLGSGYDQPENGTLIQTVSPLFSFIAGSDGSTLRGFRIYGSGGSLITVASDDMIIENNHITQNTVGGYYCVEFTSGVAADTLRNNIIGYDAVGSYRYLVGITNTTDVTISNNIFHNSQYYGIFPTSGTNNVIANNLFLSCGNGITTNGPVRISNNIFMNGTGTQISAANSPSISYNGFYNNAIDGTTGIEPIIGNPDFENFADNDTYNSASYDDDDFDFHLSSSSPGIDAGNPLFDYFDLDGSRNDLGVYGWKFPIGTTGAPTIPVVNSISVTPSTVSPSGTITINATGRIGE